MGELLKYMDYPAWIKNENNEFIFYNNTFKSKILIYEDKKEIKNFLSKTKEIREMTLDIVVLNKNLYKYVTFPCNRGKNIVGILMKMSDLEENVLNSNSVKTYMMHTLKVNLENKHAETREHTDRVAKYCLEIGKELNLDDKMLEKAVIIGILHDIGKIWISDNILLKPGKLTKEEYEIMKTHSEKGYKLIDLLPEINYVAKDILAHHERWDGNGYPLGLKRNEIPVLARIVSVADSFDAMTSDRCYSKAKTIEEAIVELKRCSGTQFDPSIVNTFIKIIDNMENKGLA